MSAAVKQAAAARALLLRATVAGAGEADLGAVAECLGRAVAALGCKGVAFWRDAEPGPAGCVRCAL